jgi:hypothetical protein
VVEIGVEHDPVLAGQRDEALALDLMAVPRLIRLPNDVNARRLSRPSADSRPR